MVDIKCNGKCAECANYGSCRPGVSKFQDKKDDPFNFCPYCHQKLYHPYTKPISKPTAKQPTGHTEIPLQCRNQDCWAIKDEIKKLKESGQKVDSAVWVTIGWAKVSTKIELKVS